MPSAALEVAHDNYEPKVTKGLGFRAYNGESYRKENGKSNGNWCYYGLYRGLRCRAYLEGQGDFVGRLVMGVTRVTLWVIGVTYPTY